ncbi:MAG: GNAT family N-acetyltransferase [Ekhidna sp.]|nr:GNAT family N-acetyltransferase [Ekhidna sp.]MBC6426907.1 GNAT family N-acetyltransferase [Ekhidna sp.]
MISVREGKKKDLTSVFSLVRELAIYENGLDQVSNTVERMELDGFGDNPIFGLLVAEEEGQIIGSSIYYYRYSTWKGKRMYLEDLIVTESKRGLGVGKLLFEATLALGRKTDCSGMMWQVLDWNEPAINFYKKYNTNFDEEWVNCNIDF